MADADGGPMDDQLLKIADSQEFGRRVREELARRRISRQALADMARISLSTLEKALAGTRPFTLASKLRIEEALGPPFRPAAPLDQPAPAAAPERLGAYVRAAVRWLEGSFLTLRPSFNTPNAIFAYVTDISWDEGQGHLVFAERQRLDADFAQRGEVSLPHLSGHIYLTTNDCGQHRMAVLSRPTISGALFGMLATLEVGSGSQLVPACCPLVLSPLARHPEPPTGVLKSDEHPQLHALLAQATAKDFARFHL
ncbi:helix-turn-helix transcriptional regulator [Sphingomonas rosea]|uniref:Helix-turn-helix transcriptional regulator n=2 Tax=Sphingomonas rosea TaxID=335605 RepID=A0ABP7U3V5_9SPHN